MFDGSQYSQALQSVQSTVATSGPVPQAKTSEIQRWSTAKVAPANRVEYFAQALGKATVAPLRIDSADPRTFAAEVSFAHLDAIEVCKITGSPHASVRGPGEVARTREHKIHLMMALNSSWSADHCGQFQLSPGDILVHDSRYPIRVEIGNAFIGLSVGVTDTWLRHWVPNPNLLSARRIAVQSPWGHALSSYLAGLSPELVAAPPLPLSVLADQVGSLLALSASSLQVAATPKYTPAIRSLNERILDCIAQRCTDSELTATDVATSMNVSLRTLHRALATVGETFGAKLIDARVRVAERMLSSPLFKRVTTAEIGRRAGFCSASHFARTMRLRTGRTPLNLRHAGI